MGEAQAELNFRVLTMLGFASTVVASWELLLLLSTFTLTDGGAANLFWCFIIVAPGMSLVYTSIAELASMCPTAGGQCDWVSELAPPKAQKLLSFLVGWLCTVGWQVYLAGVCFMVSSITQGLWHNWHGTLLTIAIIAFSIIFSTVLAARLPLIGSAVLILYLVATIIPLWVMNPHAHPHILAATAARQIWSFARDKGLPGSWWVAQVPRRQNIPLGAVRVSLVVNLLLVCINLGSSTTPSDINSLGSLSILLSYYITIGCLVWRRVAGKPLLPRRWPLGKFGIIINIAALIFLTPVWFFVFWPLATPVTAATMNWSSITFVVNIIIALIYYVVWARHQYVGPEIERKTNQNQGETRLY